MILIEEMLPEAYLHVSPLGVHGYNENKLIVLAKLDGGGIMLACLEQWVLKCDERAQKKVVVQADAKKASAMLMVWQQRKVANWGLQVQ